MPWILWGKVFFFFCLVQQFKQPMFQTSVQKTSMRIRRTTLQTLATAYYQQPAIIISALASCVALMTPAPRSSCNYQDVGGTSWSLPFAIQTSAELQNRASWFKGQLRGCRNQEQQTPLDEEDAAKQPSAASFHPFPKAAIHIICCTDQPPALKPLMLTF